MNNEHSIEPHSQDADGVGYSPAEQAIDHMSNNNGVCFDPRHFHSFRGVSVLLPMRTCGVCNQRLNAVLSFSRTDVVQCIACGMLAHRTCALSPTTEWTERCPVHTQKFPINLEPQAPDEADYSTPLIVNATTGDIQTSRTVQQTEELLNLATEETEPNPSYSEPGDNVINTPDNEPLAVNGDTTSAELPAGLLKDSASNDPIPHLVQSTTDPDEKESDVQCSIEEPPSYGLQWTADGPPAHWANSQSLEGLLPQRDTIETSNENEDPLHFSDHPFASVSRALHDNVLVHFSPVVRILAKDDQTTAESEETTRPQEDETHDPKSTTNELVPPTDGEQAQADSKPPPTTNHHMRLSLATVAGGIAGGVAGLAFAGPVGGVLAAFGQTAGLLGIVLEGSVTIGVVSSGIAAGGRAGQQLQDKLDEKRVLSLGGDSRVLLVRPTVRTDPIWLEIYDKARQSHSRGLPFRFLPSDSVKRERYERELDIVRADEDEIPTPDKVLLLVSRTLNNKESLPGHVFRQLIERARERAEERGPLANIRKRRIEVHIDPEGAEDSVSDRSSNPLYARRQDAHAVIKFVTATLLEARPSFAESPSITELTASAVEGLVFGEIYDLVMDEIEAEFEDVDQELLEKINDFERQQSMMDQDSLGYQSFVSDEALIALNNLPGAHSAADKLRYCVMFLEKISEFFSADPNKTSKAMSADSLLKMVCHHILVAKVSSLNSQIAFLDEFAQDEQLLRGKEGYALVTLQASLHFLNASTNFEADIFEQEDD